MSGRRMLSHMNNKELHFAAMPCPLPMKHSPGILLVSCSLGNDGANFDEVFRYILFHCFASWS